jgi:hypothetical protein
MIRSIIATFFVAAFFTSCSNNNNKVKKENGSRGTNGAKEASIEGSGYLQLELTIDGVPIQTDSAKFVAHDIDGLKLEAWGQRLQEGPFAYTYTWEMRLHAFRGAGTYKMTNEYGNMFWQYKSFYINPAAPGSFVADNWNSDKINGQFEFVAEDGYGDKRRVAGRFFQR